MKRSSTLDKTWVPVFLWEKFYEVSSDGEIRSVVRKAKTSFGERDYAGQIVRPIIKPNGYLCVNLTKPGLRKQVAIHKIVLESFVGERPLANQACHKNGNRQDNRLTNLRWGTVKSNHADMKLHGTALIGEKNPLSKLNDQKVAYIRNSGKSIKELSAELGVSCGCVEKAKYKSSWRHIQ